MKVSFIVNPAAGKGKAKSFVFPIEEAMKSLNEISYEICFTKKAGHATELARSAAALGCKIVYAVGGDGTVNEVMNGLVGTNSALSVLPGGSGNDFARSIDIHGDIIQIIRQTLKGKIKPIDVGIINGRYFINISSVGFDAEVALQRFKKSVFSGSAAYVAGLISTIFTCKSIKIKFKADETEFEKMILLTAVANGKYYGGGMKAAPDAILDDGKFDICIIDWLPKIKMLFLFPKFMKGKHESLKEVNFLRSEKVTLESCEPVAINIDGEVLQDTRISFEMIKKGLLVAMP